MPFASPRQTEPLVEQMVTQQVRAWNVTNDQVLDVLRRIPRQQFVPESLRHTALADTNLPLGKGQLMLAPKMEGKILQALATKLTDKALVIGAANAHLAACLAALVERVTLQDADSAVLDAARQQILAIGANNVSVRTATLDQVSSGEKFDVIVLTGAVPTIPDNLQQTLNVNGRLFAVVGTSPVMEATLTTRTSEQTWQQQSLFETDLPIISEAKRLPEFKF